MPREFVVLLAFAALFATLLHSTVWGRRIYAIGNNPEAARLSGIAVDRYRLALFMLTGAMAGLDAFLLTGRIGSTRPNIATGWELEIITVVILGGVGIAGGTGTIGGIMLAVLTIGSLVRFWPRADYHHRPLPAEAVTQAASKRFCTCRRRVECRFT